MEASTAETKRSPDCAETIKAEANVCRFCGYRFDEGRRPPATQKSVGGAVALAFFIGGALVRLTDRRAS